ncbi:MAG: hypothetical protein RJQ08_13495 [Salinisphaeraceae bacterium]
MQQERTFDFCELMQELDAGVFNGKVSRAIADVAMATIYKAKAGQKGKVTITLTMERIKDSSQITLDHQVSYDQPTPRGKATETDVTSTALYVGQRGHLSIIPDTQVEMFGQQDKEHS